MAMEAVVEVYDSDLCVMDDDEPGFYLCQPDALMLAQAIARCHQVVPDLRIIRLGKMMARCADEGVEALFARVDVS